MARILCIETSTGVCSAAIAENGKVVSVKEDATGMNHSKLLTVFIDELLKENKLEASSFDAVAVSEGPGSYTGLRIGVSAAKGICFGGGIPMIAVSPLTSMVRGVLANPDLKVENGSYLIPMIDARRMEVYCAKFNNSGEQSGEVTAEIIDENSFSDLLAGHKVYYFGDGAAKCTSVLTDTNAVFVDNVITTAKNMASIAEEKFMAGKFVDVAYFEPFYLKRFIALKPKNSVLSQVMKQK
ncbi:MAG: tRNA (adenosine(37)-N6)-threonylcarbamoyltransferase complex dimerization subunit type 1 TsaB [Prolixibacteraceae bacterium]|jgi:tRNA threonylcarbamoyladenosine biosynthesis protein TsaB|nr:tRNA (adenosine(37)-N6)-threonylcarbamoyltransferase complex dimerization subunit type 1 TsaB [Prolixibacteraceae bacterium]